MYAKEVEPVLITRFKLISNLCAFSVVLLGVFVLTGWVLDIELMKSALPGLVTMKTGTALAFLLLGLALLAANKAQTSPVYLNIKILFASVVAALGLFTLAEYVFGADFGIDELFFNIYSYGTAHAPTGRMAMATSLGFFLTGLGLLLSDVPRARLGSQLAVISSALIGVLAALGYLYDVSALYGVFAFSTLAIHTAVGFIVINLGILVARPQRGLFSVMVSKTPGGMIARYLLPLAILAPFLLGWFRVKAEKLGWVSSEFGEVIVAMAYLVLFCVITLRIAKLLREADLRRTEAESGHMQQQTMLNAMVNSAMDAIIMIDGAQKIVLFNHAAERMFGRQDTEMLGQQLDALIPVRQRGAHGARIDEFVHTSSEKRRMGSKGVLYALRANGEEFPISSSISKIEVGGETFCTVFLRDDTERQRIYESLQESEERFRSMANAAPVLIWLADDSQNRTWFNQTWLTFTGRSMEQELGNGWINGVHADDLPRFLETYRNSFTQQTAFEINYRLRNADQTYSWVLSRGVPRFGATGNFIGFIGGCTDITHQILAENQIKESKNAAEQANLMKSSFLANMSHEIRTPMNAIIGLTQLTLDSGLNPRQRDHLQKVFLSSKALLQILDDILDYSKIDAGKIELEKTEFNLEDVIQQVNDLFSAQIAEKGLDMFIKIDRSIPSQLTGDPLRLGQVLNNFVGNAIKFTDKGEIHITVDLLRNEHDKIVLCFAVKDTGIGIDKAQSDRLFSAFSQADTSFTRKYGGTGLGLTISKRLVEMMGGEVSFRSVLGEGSTFSFTALFEPGEKKVKRNDHELYGMRALVVDDQRASLDILEHHLRAWNFDVTTTICGAAAIDLLALADRAERPYELLVVDWKMPVMDGLELAQHVKTEVSQGKLKNAPTIIMLAAYDKVALLEDAAGSLCDRILAKPVTASSLFDCLFEIQQPHLSTGTPVQGAQIDFYELAAPIRGAKILLVEDNDINQEVAMEFLAQAGLHATVAQHGAQAVELVQKEKFDAVLMDIQMPVMDGLMATRLIRKMPQGLDLPIFGLSAAAMTQDIQASNDAGMTGYISKPFDPEQLIGTLLKSVTVNSDGGVKKLERVIEDARLIPAQLPGFDLPKALNRLHGNEAVLVKALLRFASDYATMPSQVDQFLHDGQTDGAAALLHRIKGVSATLGATALAQAATQFEKEVRSGTPLNSRMAFSSTMDETLKTILNNVHAPLQVETALAVALDPDHINAGLAHLASCMRNNELPDDQELAELMPNIAGYVSAERLKELNRHIQNFDFESASRTLAKVVQEWDRRLVTTDPAAGNSR